MSEVVEPAAIPPSEKAAINSMADKFKAAVASIAAPPAPAPAPAPPAPPPEPPKPAPKPAEKEKLADSSDPKRENFAKLEAEAKKWREEVTKLKPDYEATKAKAEQLQAQLESMSTLQAEHESAKKRLGEYEGIVKQLYIEHDPEFQSHFGQRISSAILEAKEGVGSANAAKVEAILQYPPSPFRDEQIAALAEDLSEFQKAELVNAYTGLKRTERERKAVLDKAPENHKKLEEARAKQAQEQAAKIDEQRKALLNFVTGKIDPELAEVEPALAATIKENVKKMVHGEMEAEQYVDFLLYGAKGQKYEKAVKDRDEKIAKLEAQLAEMQSSQPSLSGRASAPEKKGEEDIGTAYKKALAKLEKGG